MLLFITAIITVLGLILLGVLYFQVSSENKNYLLKKYRNKKEGFSDLLKYAALIDDGVVVGKDGSFIASWLYRGDDAANMTEKAQEMVSFRINQALSPMGNGWMVHVDAVRRVAPGYSKRECSHFPDKVSAEIDEERRQLFESLGTLYQGYFVITLTWLPPVVAEKRFVDLMFDDNQVESSDKEKTKKLIDEFKHACRNFESRMSAAVVLERLKADKFENENGQKVVQEELLRHLHFCATGLNHPINLPRNPIYLDALIGGQEMFPGVIPKLGRNFIQCVAIEGFPMESYPGVLTTLCQLPVEYRWNSRFIFMDAHEAEAHFKKFRKKWKQKVRGFFDQLFNTNSGMVDEDALSMVGDAAAAIAETNSGMVGQGYYTSVVVLMDEDRSLVEKSALFVEKNINALGFTARTETMNTMDAFIGSLPGHGVQNIRRPLVNTMNLADLLPTSSIWTGDECSPNPRFAPNSPPLMYGVTSGNTPFRLNLHVGELGNTFIGGPPRTGKSTLLGLIALSWLRYPDARIFAFDKGMSMYPTCAAVGGDHYVVAGEHSRLAFAPLQYLDTSGDRAWAMEWIDKILSLNGLVTTPQQRNEIASAIVSMYQSGDKTLSDFVNKVQDTEIREALKQYTIDGLMGNLLDADSDGLGISSFMTFEIEDLMNLGEKYALPVLLYLFRRIEVSLDGRPTLISLDEAWIMLAHPVFKEKIKEWLNSMAKKNCVVLLSTQHISQASDSGILDVIASSTSTKIFLPNLHARDDETSDLYKRMGLNSRQIDIISSAQPKRDYYYVSKKGQRLYQLALGQKALALVGSTDKDSIKRIKQLESEYGSKWVNHWFLEKGIDRYGEAA